MWHLRRSKLKISRGPPFEIFQTKQCQVTWHLSEAPAVFLAPHQKGLNLLWFTFGISKQRDHIWHHAERPSTPSELQHSLPAAFQRVLTGMMSRRHSDWTDPRRLQRGPRLSQLLGGAFQKQTELYSCGLTKVTSFDCNLFLLNRWLLGSAAKNLHTQHGHIAKTKHLNKKRPIALNSCLITYNQL